VTRAKYNNRRTEYRGRMYASKREAAFAAQLDALMKARGKDRVAAWSAQPRFPLVVNGVKVCTYVADFLVSYADGRTEVIDVKGQILPIFRLKMKLYEALGLGKVRVVK
jgi:hypothetical protein